jgi:ferrous iron transport protein A
MFQSDNESSVHAAEPTLGRKCFALSSAGKDSRLTIVDIPEGRARTQLIRLGIMKGEVIRCIERLPGGTVVIEKNRQEIAIGVSLAKTIVVAPATA